MVQRCMPVGLLTKLTGGHEYHFIFITGVVGWCKGIW